MKSALAVLLLLVASVVFAVTNPSLVTVLTPEGAIIEGVSGVFEESPIQLTSGFLGEPCFNHVEPFSNDTTSSGEKYDSEGSWYALGSGCDDDVFAIASTDSVVYVGGYFSVAGGTYIRGFACWSINTSSWYSLVSGLFGPGYAYAICPSSASCGFAGGNFDGIGGAGAYANNIAFWDDANDTWSALGTGCDNSVLCIAVNGSDVYVGGHFSYAGGVSANAVARWDGSSWHPLGSGVISSGVFAVATCGSDVYIGGPFQQVGGVPAEGIARWDGTSWNALGSGLFGNANAILAIGQDLYVGGSFTVAGGNPANYVARWDGDSWHPLGNGVNATVHALAVSGSDLYVGGEFSHAGGIPVNGIARWDGSEWHSLGVGVGGTWPHVYAIAVNGTDVYVGGRFTQAGGSPSNRVARWVPEPTVIEPPMGEVVPDGNTSLQATPNPFNSGTCFSFQCIGLSPLTLSIYDITGRLVRTQDLGTLPIGSHCSYWDACDGNGSPLASGTYLVRLSSVEQQSDTRVVLVR